MKKYLLKSGGSIKDAQGQDVKLATITEQVTQLAQAGRISNRDANRILKGLKQVETSVADGGTYSLGRKNIFTAQKDGTDIEGKASGLNVAGNFIDKNLSGRKVSRAIGFIQSQQKELPDPEPIQSKGITSQTIDFKDMPLPSITTADTAGLGYTPLATSKPIQEAGKKVPQATQKPVSATQKSVSTQKNISTQKSPLAFVPAQKTTAVPVTKTRLPVREANKPLPQTVNEAIPVIDLWTVEDEAREQAAKKAASEKARALSVREAGLKNNSFTLKKTAPTPALSIQKQEPGFFDSLYKDMNQAIQRSAANASIDINKRKEEEKRIDNQTLARLLKSEDLQRNAQFGIDFFKKYPNQKSYSFWVNEGLLGKRYTFIMTPDGKIVSTDNPSVATSYGGVQKKEDGGLTYALGSNPIINPKKRFVPAINPIGIDTSYPMPQKTIVQDTSVSSGELQKAILPTYRLPLAHQITTADTATGRNKSIDWLRLANAGLGVVGALSYATAKRPIFPGPVKFESNVLPATGLSEASKRMAQSQIAQQTAQANQLANTTDNHYNTAVKLQANYNANQALTNLAAQDSEVYQQNLQRVNEQQNRDAYLNHQAQQNYNQQKFELDNQYYQQRRERGTQMAQNALQYEVQRKADLENKRVVETQTNQQLAAMAEQAVIQANTTRILQGKPMLTPQEEAAIRQQYATYQTNNYQKPIARLTK